MRVATEGYVTTLHPLTGEELLVVPTGKTSGHQAQFVCISPGSNISMLWLSREQIYS